MTSSPQGGDVTVSEAFTRVDATVATPPILITCEHATNRLPPGWHWPSGDAHLAEQHWGYDLGIADFAMALAARLGAPAVLSRFSRLLIDPNRPLDSDTLFRDVADGQPIALNQGITAAESKRRVQQYYVPYHRAVNAMIAAHPGVSVLSLHSYTDLYEGEPRDVQLGVLYDTNVDYGHAWFKELSSSPFDVRMNEPWSGLAGLMYCVQSHASAHGRQAVELELRQDLLADPAATETLLDAVAKAALQLR